MPVKPRLLYLGIHIALPRLPQYALVQHIELRPHPFNCCAADAAGGTGGGAAVIASCNAAGTLQQTTGCTLLPGAQEQQLLPCTPLHIQHRHSSGSGWLRLHDQAVDI